MNKLWNDEYCVVNDLYGYGKKRDGKAHWKMENPNSGDHNRIEVWLLSDRWLRVLHVPSHKCYPCGIAEARVQRSGRETGNECLCISVH